MKKYVIVFFVLLGFSVVNAQYKSDLDKTMDIRSSILNSGGGSNFLSNLFSPENFQMHQSVSMSYSALGGGQGMALGVYTNNMFFKVADNMNFQIAASVVNSPYNSFGNNFTKSINGVYLSHAQFNYSPTKDMKISIGYSSSPFNYYGYGFSPFYNDYMYEGSPFEK